MGQPAYSVNVLERTFRILDAFSTNAQELSVTELIPKLRLPKSTVHRLVMVLERHGYVERSSTGDKYHLGAKLVQLGMHALTSIDLGRVAMPHLERLVKQTGETAHLGVLRDGEIISLFHSQSAHVLRPPTTVGRRIPVYCTSLGKAILAFLPEGEKKRILADIHFKAYTPKTIKRISEFKAQLTRVRNAGYATDNEEFEEGLRCIGAPVRDHSGDVIAAISIAMPSVRMKKHRVPQLTRAVVKTAAELSVALGYLQVRSPEHRH
jgi:DNA-binding IclR family transcriptional regulator